MEIKPLRMLPCPHCGKSVAVILNLELEKPYCSCVCVVCDVSQGGCGATGGFTTSEEKAIEKWNERYTQYDQEFWGTKE